MLQHSSWSVCVYEKQTLNSFYVAQIALFLAIFTFHHNFVCINTIIFVLLKLFSMFFGRLLLHSAIVLNFLRENNVPKLFLFTVMYEYFDQECFFCPHSRSQYKLALVPLYESISRCARIFFSAQYKTK